MQTFVQFFSKLVAPHLPPLMAQAWHLFLASQSVYQQHVINNTPDLDADQVLASYHQGCLKMSLVARDLLR